MQSLRQEEFTVKKLRPCSVGVLDEVT
jgi:hypothetical protein